MQKLHALSVLAVTSFSLGLILNSLLPNLAPLALEAWAFNPIGLAMNLTVALIVTATLVYGRTQLFQKTKKSANKPLRTVLALAIASDILLMLLCLGSFLASSQAWHLSHTLTTLPLTSLIVGLVAFCIVLTIMGKFFGSLLNTPRAPHPTAETDNNLAKKMPKASSKITQIIGLNFLILALIGLGLFALASPIQMPLAQVLHLPPELLFLLPGITLIASLLQVKALDIETSLYDNKGQLTFTYDGTPATGLSSLGHRQSASPTETCNK